MIEQSNLQVGDLSYAVISADRDLAVQPILHIAQIVDDEVKKVIDVG